MCWREHPEEAKEMWPWWWSPQEGKNLRHLKWEQEQKRSTTPKCRCASFISTSIQDIDSAYYALYKVTNSALKRSVTLSCRVFPPRLRDLYIDLTGKMIVCDTWYKFLESTESMEMVKFIYLFFCFICNELTRSWKSRIRSISPFILFPLPLQKEILNPRSSSLPLWFSVTKGCSFSLNSGSRHKQ